MLVTSETAMNVRIRKRFGVVHGEGILLSKVVFSKKLLSLFIKSTDINRKTLNCNF